MAIAFFQCTQCTDAYWDRSIGYRVGHSSNAVTNLPESFNGSLSNKLARQIKSQPVKHQYWPLTGPLRILGVLDASYRKNDDGSSQ